MDRPDVFMPLYIGDYLAGTSRLTTELHGAYLLLIMDYWMNGPPPDDDQVLASIAKMVPEKWAVAKLTLAKFFQVEDGEWKHKRISHELESAISRKKSKAESGSKGGRAKWGEPDGNKQNRSERLAAARRLARHSPEEWHAMKVICGSECVRCGVDGAELVKDHIQPIYQGGSDGIENLQPLCRGCNASKGPECVDHRPLDWRERLAKCMANALPSPSPSPSLNKTTTGESPKNEEPKIEFQKIAELYNEILGETLGTIRAISPERRKHIKARINEEPEKRISPEWWGTYFELVSVTPFLTGHGPPKPDTGKPWKADFDWLINPNNMIKTLERKYDRE